MWAKFLIILSLLHSRMNCGKSCDKTYHLGLNFIRYALPMRMFNYTGVHSIHRCMNVACIVQKWGGGGKIVYGKSYQILECITSTYSFSSIILHLCVTM